MTWHSIRTTIAVDGAAFCRLEPFAELLIEGSFQTLVKHQVEDTFTGIFWPNTTTILENSWLPQDSQLFTLFFHAHFPSWILDKSWMENLLLYKMLLKRRNNLSFFNYLFISCKSKVRREFRNKYFRISKIKYLKH